MNGYKVTLDAYIVNRIKSESFQMIDLQQRQSKLLQVCIQLFTLIVLLENLKKRWTYNVS